jgi:hypothetical protein
VLAVRWWGLHVMRAERDQNGPAESFSQRRAHTWYIGKRRRVSRGAPGQREQHLRLEGTPPPNRLAPQEGSLEPSETSSDFPIESGQFRTRSTAITAGAM